MSGFVVRERASAAELQPPEGPRLLRNILGRFVTGVSVVTASHDGVPHGCTANSFTSLSLEPPLVLVCLRRGSRLLDIIARSGAFAVNVLHEEQLHLAERFADASRAVGEAEFAGVDWQASPLGSPLLGKAIAQIDCELRSVADGGDHVVCIGRIQALASRAGKPLLFSDGSFARVGEWVEGASVPEAWPWI